MKEKRGLVGFWHNPVIPILATGILYLSADMSGNPVDPVPEHMDGAMSAGWRALCRFCRVHP